MLSDYIYIYMNVSARCHGRVSKLVSSKERGGTTNPRIDLPVLMDIANGTGAFARVEQWLVRFCWATAYTAGICIKHTCGCVWPHIIITNHRN